MASKVKSDLNVEGVLQRNGNSVSTEDVRLASGLGVVVHGASTGTARPTGYAKVLWIGSANPANAVDGDIRLNTGA